MHFNVKLRASKYITLHSNFQMFLQHFTQIFFDIGRFVLNMKISHYIEDLHALK